MKHLQIYFSQNPVIVSVVFKLLNGTKLVKKNNPLNQSGYLKQDIKSLQTVPHFLLLSVGATLHSPKFTDIHQHSLPRVQFHHLLFVLQVLWAVASVIYINPMCTCVCMCVCVCVCVYVCALSIGGSQSLRRLPRSGLMLCELCHISLPCAGCWVCVVPVHVALCCRRFVSFSESWAPAAVN